MATVKILKLDTGGVQFIDQTGDKLAQFTPAASMKLLRKDNKILITDRGSEEHAVDSDAVTTLTVGGVDTPFAGDVQALWDELAADFFFIVDPTSGTSPQLYDAVVDAGGNGDYLLPSAAIAAGACSIFVRAGIYTEVADVPLASLCSIVGETAGTIINFPAGFGIVSDAGGTVTTAGDISITTGTAAVVGVGTSFTGRAGEYIRIGEQFYKILSVTDALNLTLEKTYKGKTVTNSTDFSIRPYVVGVNIESLNLQGGGVSDPLIQWEGVLNSTIKKVAASGSGFSNIALTDVGISDVENVISHDATSNGLNLSDCTGLKIAESVFYNNAGIGVSFSGGLALTFDTCFFNHNAGDGMDGTTSDRIIIGDCQAHGNNVRGIHINTSVDNIGINNCNVSGFVTSGITNGSTTSGSITNCIVQGSGFAITAGISCLIGQNYVTDGVILVGLAGNGNGKILGNNVKNASGNAIQIEGPNMLVQNNTIEGATGAGIRVTLAADNANVSNNNIINGLATGIVISTDGCKINNNIFDGNVADIIIVGNIYLNTEIDGIIYNNTQTSDATPRVITTIPLPTNGREYSFKIYVGAEEQSTGAKFGTWHRTLVVQKSSIGTPTITLFNADIDAQTGLVPASVNAIVNGGDIDIQITGNAGETIAWSAGHKFLNQTKFFL